MDQKQLQYTSYFTSLAQAGNVTSDCNSIVFINYGTTNVVINDVCIIYPFNTNGLPSEFEDSGNVGEINRTEYRIAFKDPTGVNPNVVNGNVVIIRKYYQNNK